MIFNEEMPEEFKKKFYKVKFYANALMCEHNKTDENQKFIIENEKERKYYSEFLSEIIEKVHKESNDAELLKFMDKYLPIKNIEMILNDYEKIIALLRIEKYGREGLFTLKLFGNDLIRKFYSIDKLLECNFFNGADFFSTFSSSTEKLSLDDVKIMYGTDETEISYEKIGIFNSSINSTYSKFALEIFKLWSKTPKQESDFHKLLYSSTKSIPASIEIPRYFSNLNFKIDTDKTKRVVCANKFDKSHKASPNIYCNASEFHAYIEQSINRKNRLERKINKEHPNWKTKKIEAFYKDSSGEYQQVQIALAEIIGRYSIAIEKITNGRVKKESIANRILEFDNFSIEYNNFDMAYLDKDGNVHIDLIIDAFFSSYNGTNNLMFNIAKTLTRCLLYNKDDERFKKEEHFTHDSNSSEDKMAEFIAHYITKEGYMGSSQYLKDSEVEYYQQADKYLENFVNSILSENGRNFHILEGETK